MQVIFGMLVLALAGLAFLVFLVVPQLRRHALKAVAAVFGFAAGSMGSALICLVAYWLSGFTEDTVRAWAVGVRGVILAILWNMIFYGGGIAGALLAVRAAGWVQARLPAGRA